jgi:penicillin-binding protein-related factor A (putative recombinase)
MTTAWQKAETDFEDALDALGKSAYYHRLTDASDIKGLTGQVSNQACQPSDYIVVVRGVTYFAEVKSTSDATAFRFSLLRPSQSAHALRITRAGGQHTVWVKHVPSARWFKVPYTQIEATKAAGKMSIPWKELTPCTP